MPEGPPSSAPWTPGDVVDGRLRLDGVLGRGGMGVVFRARDLGRGVDVAVKALDAALAGRVDLARFEREAALTAALDGIEGVVRVDAAGVHAGRRYYVMELVEGRALDALARDGLDPDRAARIVARAARVVAACHARGVVHRDLKPHNVLVASDDRPRIVDFGVALDLAGTRLTATGEVLGTPAFMAPEQVLGAPTDARTDVYALGATLFHALAGRPPFEGGAMEVLSRVAAGAAPDVRAVAPGVPPPIAAICARAMRADPAARYPDAAALASDLERAARGEALAAPRASRRLALGLALGALGALALGLVEPVAQRARRARALDALLEADGAWCAAGQRACAGGAHELAAWALGTGPGLAPDLAALDARRGDARALLAAQGDGERGAMLAEALARLDAHARLLRRGRERRAPDEAGPTSDLVDALLALDGQQGPDGARAVWPPALRAAARPDAPPGARAIALRAARARLDGRASIGARPPAGLASDEVAALLAALPGAGLARSEVEGPLAAWARREAERAHQAWRDARPGPDALAAVAPLGSLVALCAPPGPAHDALEAARAAARERLVRDAPELTSRLLAIDRAAHVPAVEALLAVCGDELEAAEAVRAALLEAARRDPGALAAALRVDALLRARAPRLVPLAAYAALIARAMDLLGQAPLLDPEVALGLLVHGAEVLQNERGNLALDHLRQNASALPALLAERPASMAARFAFVCARPGARSLDDLRRAVDATRAVLDAPVRDLDAQFLSDVEEQRCEALTDLLDQLPLDDPTWAPLLAEAEESLARELEAQQGLFTVKVNDLREGLGRLAAVRHKRSGLAGVEATVAQARAWVAGLEGVGDGRPIVLATLLIGVIEWCAGEGRDRGTWAVAERLGLEVLDLAGLRHIDLEALRVRQNARALTARARRHQGDLPGALQVLEPALQESPWYRLLLFEVVLLTDAAHEAGLLERARALERCDLALERVAPGRDQAADEDLVARARARILER